MKRRSCGLLLAILFLLLVPAARAAPEEVREVTVLFTHDLHSHFLPQTDGQGGESGGYARLSTALDRERQTHPDAVTVDGGDFAVGSLIQALYTTRGAELRTMGAMGYDAVTAGNHEFDYRGTGFGEMLTAAALSGEPLPALVMANYRPAQDNPERLDIQRAMAACGAQEYVLLERGGVTFGIFGLMGEDAHACAPTSGFALGDPVQTAQRCVDALKEQGAEFIICLSHSGTNEKKKLSEDERLAEEVAGIDLIVSGHTHTTLEEPILAGNTYIVSAGAFCENLGSITLRLEGEGTKLSNYRLIPIDETLPEDPALSALVEEWKLQVEGTYLGRYGLGYDQVLTTAGFPLNTPESGVQAGNPLGELVADAFLWAARELAESGASPPAVAITADGVLRASLPLGEITTSMAFDVLSMGVGEDGTAGFPLVEVYLTGRELRTVAEVDASVTPLMPAAQLYLAGLEYSFNTHRVCFNRVTSCRLVNEYSSYELEDDGLYRVVTGMYSAQMLDTVRKKSFGLLSLEPKMADGTPVSDFEACILRDRNGSEIKEWYALAAYLRQYGEEGLPERYARPDGRKQVSRSWNPFELLKITNGFSLAVLGGLAVLALLAWFLLRKLRAARKRRRYGGSFRQW